MTDLTPFNINMNRAAAALAYARRGWSVFPLHERESRHNGKTSTTNSPIGHLVPMGFKQATTDIRTVEKWWKVRQTANVGFVPFSAGLVCFDVDVKNGKRGIEQLQALEDSLGELPATLKQRTPSGGFHLFFKCPQPFDNFHLPGAPDIDIRSRAGYVALEPSANGAEYAFDDWSWDSESDPEIADLPQPWVEALQAAQKPATPPAKPADNPNPLQVADDFADRFNEFLETWSKAKARWEGTREGMRDSSDSAMILSLARYMNMMGEFTLGEYIEAVNHGGQNRSHWPALRGPRRLHELRRTWDKARAGLVSGDFEAMEGEWQQPAPLHDDDEGDPAPEYPTGTLPTVLRQAVEAIADAVPVPAAMAAQSVLAASALVAQRLYNAPHVTDSFGMPCSLNMLTEAESGDRKSGADKVAMYPLHKMEREQAIAFKAAMDDFKAEQANKKKKDKTASPPADSKCIFTDTTFEAVASHLISGGNPSVGLFADEGGQFLGGHSMKSDTRLSAIAGLTALFDSGRCERSRSSEGVVRGTVFDRRLSIHLMAQPIALQETMSDPLLLQQGFLCRFLYAAPTSLAGTRFLDADIPPPRIDLDTRMKRYWERLEGLAKVAATTDEAGGLVCQTLQMTDKAQRLWVNAYNHHEREQRKGGEFYGAMRPFAGRFGELARRVATVLAVMDDESDLPGIEAAHMTAAIAIVQHSLAEWKRQLTHGAHRQAVRNARSLLAWLQSNPQHRTLQDVYQKATPVHLRSKSVAVDALTYLQSMGWLRQNKDGFKGFTVHGDSDPR